MPAPVLRTKPLPAPSCGTAWRKAPTPRARVWIDTTDGPTACTIWWTSPWCSRSDAGAAAIACELVAGAALTAWSWLRATIPPATRAPVTAPTTTPARNRRPGPAASTQGRRGRAAGGVGGWGCGEDGGSSRGGGGGGEAGAVRRGGRGGTGGPPPQGGPPAPGAEGPGGPLCGAAG